MTKARYIGFDIQYCELKRQTSVEYHNNGEWFLIDIMVTKSLSVSDCKLYESDYVAEFMCPEDVSDLNSFEKDELLEMAIIGLKSEDKDLNFGSFK